MRPVCENYFDGQRDLLFPSSAFNETFRCSGLQGTLSKTPDPLSLQPASLPTSTAATQALGGVVSAMVFAQLLTGGVGGGSGLAQGVRGMQASLISRRLRLMCAASTTDDNSSDTTGTMCCDAGVSPTQMEIGEGRGTSTYCQSCSAQQLATPRLLLLPSWQGRLYQRP